MPESLILSREFLDPSEIGDLVNSLSGDLVVEEAITDRELHFEFPEDDGSTMFCDFNSLLVLHECALVLLQMKHWKGCDEKTLKINCNTIKHETTKVATIILDPKPFSVTCDVRTSKSLLIEIKGLTLLSKRIPLVIYRETLQ